MGIELGIASLFTFLSANAATIGGVALGAGAALGGKALMDSNGKKESTSEASKTQDIGNLGQGEVDEAASKRAYRAGSFLTSPTGLNQGSRGRSRLMGG